MATKAATAKRTAPRGAESEKQRFRLTPAERERLIVDEAIQFFSEVGFGGQTRELSRRLGITQPLLYRYFPSKQALIERVYREVYLGRWDPTWETLLDDRSKSLRTRLIEFYRRYTAVTFRPEWIRLYMYSGLAGIGFNRRYIELLERLLLRRICVELRASLGLPDDKRLPIQPAEMELVWDLQGGIYYYGVRKFIYKLRVPQEPAQSIEHAVDSFLEGAPRVLRRILKGRHAARRA
ncbi:MAG: helix-turn-helix domain-containing protein [Burkholderiales bacterium]